MARTILHPYADADEEACRHIPFKRSERRAGFFVFSIRDSFQK
jgi:hypothetical protein